MGSEEQRRHNTGGAATHLGEDILQQRIAEKLRLKLFLNLWKNDVEKFGGHHTESQVPLSPGGDGGAPDDEDEDDEDYQRRVPPEREEWGGRFDFLLSLLGYSVGLGNVWRFPYLCYNNGGGAFLLPFVLMLLLAGLPLMFMELAFGQFASLGPIAIYGQFCPLFHGLGCGMVIVSAVVMLYYNVIIAWTLFYLVASFGERVPWDNCSPDWSTSACYSYQDADECASHEGGVYFNRSCHNFTLVRFNFTNLLAKMEKKPPAEEYFTNHVLGMSAGIEWMGGIRWQLALALFGAWVIVFLCLSKGVQSSGKVVYFTALFPYVVLVILFFRGITLPGAGTGIMFYLTPDFSRLTSAQVWGDAALQIFFALSPAWGGLITLASYNKFNNNCYKDALIVSVSNILTSIFAGLVIFSVIGYLAHELDVDVDKVVDEGAGLAFIVYPEIVARLPVAPLWAALFFFMLLTLGLDSQFALMETVTTAILDKFPRLRERKTYVVLAVSLLGYAGGLIFTTNAGMYWLQLMDKYAANWSVLLIAITECILVAWVYGAERFLQNIEEMIGFQSRRWHLFWTLMWKYLTPATLLFILIFNWVMYVPATLGQYVYPTWANAVGWVFAIAPIAIVVCITIHKFCTTPFSDGTCREKVKFCLEPTPEWGLRVPKPPLGESNQIEVLEQEVDDDGLTMDCNRLAEERSNSFSNGAGGGGYSKEQEQAMADFFSDETETEM